MNLTTIKKYFESSYKAGQKIYISRIDNEELFISDGLILLPQHLMNPVFYSRDMFSQMPPEGKIFTYQKKYGVSDGGPALISVWKSTVDASTDVVKITEWTHGGVLATPACRVFILSDEQHLFIQEKFLALFISKDTGLFDYCYTSKSPLSPLVVRQGDTDPLAILMPIRKEASDINYLTEPVKEVNQ